MKYKVGILHIQDTFYENRVEAINAGFDPVCVECFSDIRSNIDFLWIPPFEGLDAADDCFNSKYKQELSLIPCEPQEVRMFFNGVDSKFMQYCSINNQRRFPVFCNGESFFYVSSKYFYGLPLKIQEGKITFAGQVSGMDYDKHGRLSIRNNNFLGGQALEIYSNDVLDWLSSMKEDDRPSPPFQLVSV